MKGRILKRSLSAALVMAMVMGNVSGTTSFAETNEVTETETETEKEGDAASKEISLVNSDMSADIWGDNAGWKVEVDDWTATGASIKNFTYSSDQWMDKPSDGSDDGINFWFGEGAGVLIFSQDVELEKGSYTLSAEAMGESGDFYVEALDSSSDKVSLSGYNNWLTESCEFTLSDDSDSVTVKVIFDVEKDGWGYLNSVKLSKSSSSSEDEESTESETDETGAEASEGAASGGVSTGESTDGEGTASEDSEEGKAWMATTLVANGDFETGDDSSWKVEMADADGNTVAVL